MEWKVFALSHVRTEEVDTLISAVGPDIALIMRTIVKNAHIQFFKTVTDPNPKRVPGYSWSRAFDKEYHGLRAKSYEQTKRILLDCFQKQEAFESFFCSLMRKVIKLSFDKEKILVQDCIQDLPNLIRLLEEHPNYFDGSNAISLIEYGPNDTQYYNYEEYEEVLVQYFSDCARKQVYDQLIKPYSKEWNTFRRALVRRQDTILKSCEVSLAARLLKEVEKDFDSNPKLSAKLNRMAKKQCQEIVESLTEKPTKKKRRTSSKQKKQREMYTTDFITEVLEDVKIGAEKGVEESIEKKGGKIIKNKSGYANSLVQHWQKSLTTALITAKEKIWNEQKQAFSTYSEEINELFTQQPFYRNAVNGVGGDIKEKIEDQLSKDVAQDLQALISLVTSDATLTTERKNEYYSQLGERFAYNKKKLNLLIQNKPDEYVRQLEMYSWRITYSTVRNFFAEKSQALQYLAPPQEYIDPDEDPRGWYYVAKLCPTVNNEDYIIEFGKKNQIDERYEAADRFFIRDFHVAHAVKGDLQHLYNVVDNRVFPNVDFLKLKDTISNIKGPMVVSGIYNGVWKIVNDIFLLFYNEIVLYPQSLYGNEIKCAGMLNAGQSSDGIRPSKLYKKLLDWAESNPEYARIDCRHPEKVEKYEQRQAEKEAQKKEG